MQVSDEKLSELLVDFEHISGRKISLEEARPVAELIVRLVGALYEPIKNEDELLNDR